MATAIEIAMANAKAEIDRQKKQISTLGGELNFTADQITQALNQGVARGEFGTTINFLKKTVGDPNQDSRNIAIGKEFSHSTFNSFRESTAADVVRIETGARRQRGFTGALRGGRAFLARERTDDQNDRPFLGG